MWCDYCGLATGAVACWEVSAGLPGVGMTRYVCAVHKRAAVAWVGARGPVLVVETNVEYWRRQAQVVALPARAETIGEAA